MPGGFLGGGTESDGRMSFPQNFLQPVDKWRRVLGIGIVYINVLDGPCGAGKGGLVGPLYAGADDGQGVGIGRGQMAHRHTSHTTGAQGGEAIAALLTGTANPCGKLPCTVARHEGQIPVYYNHPTNTCYSMTGGTPKNAYIDGAHTPRYCFGHGLSYTKYEYDTLRLEKDAIQADGVLKGRLHVRNAGNKAGTEIVQFYVHDVAASMVRPVKELVGFAKVNLQPGEEKTVCLSLPMSQLAFLDADMRWKVEHGKVELMVGASSEDIRGKAEFMIVGDAYPDGKNRSFVADTKIM